MTSPNGMKVDVKRVETCRGGPYRVKTYAADEAAQAFGEWDAKPDKVRY